MRLSNARPSDDRPPEARSAFGRIAARLGNKYFNRLKIGGKLTIGFGILGALTMLVIGLSYLGSYRATRNINRTADVRVPTALASARAQADLLRMQASVQAYLALGDRTYRESYDQARQAFEADLAELDDLARRHDTSISNPEFDRRLDALRSAYTQWSALPEQLFDLRDDQLKREPALRLLIEEANPLIIPILVDINAIITTQREREPSAGNLALLGDMANFQASFFAMVAGLRGYVTTGRASFQFEYSSNVTVNNSAWEQLVKNQAQLESNQRDTLHNISQAREAFMALPPQMFEAVRGEHAREDLFLFRTQAVPLAETSLRLLDELTADEQHLLQADLSEGREQLAVAQWQTLAGGVVAFFLGLTLAFIFRENIAGPVRRLTRVAEQIAAGDLTARTPVESGDEIGTLAETFNQMTGRLSETLDDLEQRRSDLQQSAETLRRQNEYLAALQETSLGLMSRLDLNELLEALVTRAAHLLEAPHGLIYLVEPGSGVLERKVGMGVFSQELGFQIKPGEGLAGRVWQTGQPLIVDDYDTWLERLPDFEYGVIGALMEVPLTQTGDTGATGSQVVGVIGMAYDAGSNRTFGQAEIELLSQFAQLASVALDNAHLFQAERAQAARQAALFRLSGALAAAPDEDTICQALVDGLRDEDLGYTYIGVFLVDKGSGERMLRSAAGPSNAEIGLRLRADQGLSGRALDGRLHYTPDVTREVQYVPALNGGSEVDVPILINTEVAGVLVVESRQPDAFGQADFDVLSAAANQAGVALGRARSLAETEQRAAELALINSVQQGLTLKLDFQAIIDLVGNKIQQIFDAQTTHIRLYDQRTNLIQHAFVLEHGERLFIEPELLDDKGISHFIIQNRRPLVINRAAKEKMEALGSHPYPQQKGWPQSLVAVPITNGEQLTGLIVLANYDSENAYPDSDVRLLETLAFSLSVGLENARLFDETQRLLQETEQRAAELAMLNSVGQAMTQQLDVKTIARIVGDKVRDIFTADATAIVLFDVQTNLLTNIYYYNKVYGYDVDIEGGTWPLGQGLISIVVQSRQPLVLGAKQEGLERGAISATVVGDETQIRPIPEEDPNESWLGVPIVVGERVLGVVNVQSFRQHAFNQDSIRLLSTLAASMGVAIENAQLFEAQRRRAHEMAALAEVGREISASLDLPTVLERIATHAKDLLHGRDVVLRLLEPDGRLPAVVALGKYAEIYKAWQVQLGYGLTGHIAQTGVAEIVNEPQQDPRVASIPGTEEDDATKAMLFAPLLTREKVIGVMTVWRDKTVSGPFAQSDMDFMVGLARQAAIAIENARLFDEIQRQKQFSEALIETSPVAIVLCDLDEQVTAWNPAAEMLFGYTGAEAVGRHLDDLVANRSDIRQDANRYTPATQATYQGVGHHGIGRRTRKDGQLVDVEFFAVPVVVGGQDVAGIILYHDITELNRARQEAIAANAAKSTFLATMSHEIRTPMNGVIGMTGLLLGTDLTAEQREYAEMVRGSAEALLTVINDILDFSKIEADKLELEQQPFDLRDCVESALDLVATKAAEKQLDLAALFDEDVPPAIVGDVTRVRQILLNLLANAVKFTERGEVVVSVMSDEWRVTSDDANDTRHPSPVTLHFAVRDTGIGIPPEGLARLFQSFSQVDASTTRKYGGTGLGLAISKRLAELMGGQLWVESTVGAGTTFHFSIAAAAAPALNARPHLNAVAPALAGKRVLVVDDNATNRRILTLQLARWGMQVRDTASPHEALAWVRAGEPFDLAILDMMMPEIDGLALASAIRAERDERALPLILCSSLGRREAGPAGVTFAAYLTKPLKPSQLFDALITLFAGAPALQAPAKKAPAVTTDAGMAARHPLRILLAEDNAVNQKLALRLLSQMSYRTDVAGNGLEAIEAVERQPYDVVLMDVQMPELDGLEATKRIRALTLAAGQPHIVAMTANAMQGDRELCLQAGMDDYISKPIKVEELIGALERARPLERATGAPR